MTDFRLEPLLLRLAEEFKRRDMRGHLDLLRAFYRAHRARKRLLLRETPPPWDEDMVMEWLCIMQIEPFERVYPVLANGASCPRCAAAHDHLASSNVRGTFPGGTLYECTRCSARWLVRERT